MQKNDLLTGFVDSLGYSGEGIVKKDGTVIFVPFALENEEISFKILKVKKNIAYGKLEKIISASGKRVEPKCPVFKKCGGCQLQHLSYSEQLNCKEKIVKDCFKKIAGLEITIDKKFSSPKDYGYRNKLQLPVRMQKGEIKVGFFRENSHDVINTDDCPLQPDWAKKVIAAIRGFIEKSGVSCYDDSTKKGLLRHVVVREISGEFLFTVVLNGKTKKYDNGLIEALSTVFDKFSLVINVNERADNVILGDDYRTIFGSGKIAVEEFGVNYELGAMSFYQVNTPVKTEIYKDVFALSSIDDKTVVIDAYSGAGVLTAMLSERAKKAYGIEIVSEAVDSANDLAKRNDIYNMENICAPCEIALPKIVKKAKGEGEKCVLVLDPPRKGVDKNALLSVLESLPDEIVYISCSPQTLARDIGVLVGSLKEQNGALINLSGDFSPNYQIKFVGIYDMFPQTRHIETVVRLSRSDINS